MIRVYRLMRRKYADRPLDGEGARIYGGRWNPPGIPVVYTSESLSLACLELLVHLKLEELPADLVSVAIDFPDDLSIMRVELSALPGDWCRYPAPPELQAIGQTWVRERQSAVLRVPSVVVLGEHNYLINPSHPEFRRILIQDGEHFAIDNRLLKSSNN